MTTKILVATHKKASIPTNPPYIPIHVGSIGKQSIGYLRDNQGDHMSQLNPYLSELTGLYWGWKNLEVDTIGIVHYRRYLVMPGRRFEKEKSLEEQVLSQTDIDQILVDYDIILPKKRHYYIETLSSHYANTFDEHHLQVARQALEKLRPEYLSAFDRVMQQKAGYMFNMYIAPKKISDAYCQWLFPILEEMSHYITTENLNEFEKRLFGRVSELLFNVWLAERDYRIFEANHIYTDDINWIYKISRFLQAKFFGVKYDKSF